MDGERDYTIEGCESSIQSGHIRAVDILCPPPSAGQPHSKHHAVLVGVLHMNPTHNTPYSGVLAIYTRGTGSAQPQRRVFSPFSASLNTLGGTQRQHKDIYSNCRRSVQTIARGRGGSIFYFEPIFNIILIITYYKYHNINSILAVIYYANKQVSETDSSSCGELQHEHFPVFLFLT